ncbi:MAG: hypothetical protein MJ016_00925 [Victivallaceae bacterium]|nr:hypothetical protein [Victivallaceae bacterium]
MLILYLNTITGEFYDADGNGFRNGRPALSIKSKEKIKIICCSDTPEASSDSVDPSTWTRDSRYAQYSNFGAVITCDSDYIQKIEGSLASAVEIGEQTTISTTITGASFGRVKKAGTLRLFSNDGTYEAVAYTNRTISGNSVVFDVSGVELTHAYSVGATIDCDQSPYCEAFLNLIESNKSRGEFVFDLIADGDRIREETDYASVANLSIAGLEFLPYYIDANNKTIRLPKYLCTTFALVGVQGNPDGEGELPDAMENKIASTIDAKIGGDVRIDTEVVGGTTTARLVLAGVGGTSNVFVIPNGNIVTGAGEVQIFVDGGTATLVNTVTGGTATIGISGGTTIALDEDFLGVFGRCEYDLIDGEGNNITTSPDVSRQWGIDAYYITLSSGFSYGNYAAKPCGIKGDKGEKGDDATEIVGSDAIGVETVGGTSRIVLLTEAQIFGGTSSLSDDHNVLALKQDALTAGNGITISAGTISAAINGDYTSFEVYANDSTIPAGSTDFPEFVVDGVGPAVDIPAGMTHAMKFKTLGTEDIRIEWGDGTTTVKPASELTPDGSWTGEHTYTAAGKYLVKVYGGFTRIQTVSWKNLVHRVLDFDLPVAATHTNLQEFAANALRLVAVRFNDQLPPDRFGNILGTFTGCTNLRKVTGMDRIGVCNTVSQLFKDCPNLVNCAFVLPPSVVISTSGANGYRGVFYSSTNRAQALSGDLASFFPDRGFTADEVDLTQLFYNYRPNVKYPNITLSDAGAAKLARVLWLSGKTFHARSTVAVTESGSATTTDGIFRCFPAAVRAKIPVWWGGTMVGVYCDPATGSVPAWQGVKYNTMLFFDGNGAQIPTSVAGGTASLVRTETTWQSNIDATNCCVNFDNRAEGNREPYGDVVFRGGTFTPIEAALESNNTLAFINSLIPGGVFLSTVQNTFTFDHCFCAALFDNGSADQINIIGGTFRLPDDGYVMGHFSLSDNAVFNYPLRYGSVATIVYDAGCTINGEVKTSGGTIVLE